MAEADFKNKLGRASLKPGVQDVYIGIDSGSTTTKIVVTDSDDNILFTYYKPNGGHAIETVAEGLNLLKEQCLKTQTTLNIKGSCSTGYGEDLIKAAFQLDAGIVETIAHYVAAHYLDKDVSFILDIGGQDMKAIFVNDGIIDRIEINEACSSGCGSFIETLPIRWDIRHTIFTGCLPFFETVRSGFTLYGVHEFEGKASAS